MRAPGMLATKALFSAPLLSPLRSVDIRAFQVLCVEGSLKH